MFSESFLESVHEITVMPLLEHVWQTVWLYLSMWFRLKLVGSDKLLEYVLWLKYYMYIS